MDTSDVVELRVHGVSGTPPEELLDRPLVVRVAGDDKAGFYRPRLFAERTDDPVLTPPEAERGPALEGYAWGGLTSGGPTRALWLLLLPFTLLNVAPRMRPPAELHLRLMWVATRLLALSMTLLFLAGLAGVGEDLFAWQCGAAPGDATLAACSAASPGWLMTRLLALDPAHRLAVGALLPLLVLVLMWQVSGRTIRNYEQVTAPAMAGASEDGAEDVEVAETGLGSRWMWRNEFQVRRLRQLHLQTGLAGVLWSVAAPMAGAVRGVDVAVVIGVVGYAVVMLAWPNYTGRAPSARFERVNTGVWIVLGGCAVWTAARLILVDRALAERPAGGGLPYYATSVLVLFLVQIGLLTGFCVVIALIRHAARRARPRAGRLSTPDRPTGAPPIGLDGWGAVVFATLGVFFGAVFSSGIYVFAAAWLHTGSVKPGFGAVSRTVALFAVPDVIKVGTLAYVVCVAGLVVILVGVAGWWAVWRWRFTRHPDRSWSDALDEDYGPPDRRGPDAGRDRQILGIWWAGGLVERAGPIVGTVVGVGAVVSVTVIVMLLGQVGGWSGFSGTTDWLGYRGRALTASGGRRTGVIWEHGLSSRFLEATGAYLVVLTLLGLVTLGAAAFRVARTRRSVGILWDLGSFWPRSAHPFGAPCYAERTVPDLTTRLYDDTTRRDKGIVLAAHSQGTVISAATLEQLATIDRSAPADDRVLPRIALLTFGCVLRRLYARYFPAYFGAALLADIPVILAAGPDRPSRWRNLWRHSDYLGGPVTHDPGPVTHDPGPVTHDPGPGTHDPGPADDVDGAGLDVRLVDPGYARPPGDTIYPAPDRHSNYWRDPQFQRHVRELARVLPARAAAPHPEQAAAPAPDQAAAPAPTAARR